MNRLLDVLAKLDELTTTPEPRADGADLKPLAASVAGALRAESCSISLSDDNGVASDALAAGAAAIELPIAVGTKRYGTIALHGLRGAAGRKREEDLQFIAWCIAHVLESAGMRCVLRSRYAQFAIAKRSEMQRLLAASAQHPDKTARLLARTFYLELARSGFSCNQIINAASEIISQLSLNLQQKKIAACRAHVSEVTPVATAVAASVASVASSVAPFVNSAIESTVESTAF